MVFKHYHGLKSNVTKAYKCGSRNISQCFISVFVLFQAMGNMQRLADDINQLNQRNQPIKDAQITTINRSMIRILSTFESLAQFKENKQSKIPALASLPVSVEEAEAWKLELGSDTGPILGLLQHTMYGYK